MHRQSNETIGISRNGTYVSHRPASLNTLFSSPFAWLIGFVLVASFWSTAFVEIGSALLILLFLFTRLRAYRNDPAPESTTTLSLRACLVPLVLWSGYVCGIILSFVASGTSPFRHPGLLWHPLVFPAVLLQRLRTDDLRRIGKGVVVSAAIASLVTLFRFYHLGETKQFSTSVGLTTFAELIALGGIVAAFLLGNTRERSGVRILIACACLGLFLTTLWTIEITAIGMFVLAGILTVSTWRPRQQFAALAVLLLVLFVSPRDDKTKVLWMVHGHQIDRYVAWKEGFKLLPNVPLFGFGPDCYTRVLPAEAWSKFANRPPGSWHNDFLQTALDSGYVALGCLAGLVLAALATSVSGSLRTKDPERRNLLRSSGLLLVCMIGFALVGGVVTTAILGVVFWVVLGVTLQLALDVPPTD